jgi:transposase-like protein
MNEPLSTNPRRKYNAQFKREAVKHWLSSGKSAQAIAQGGGAPTCLATAQTCHANGMIFGPWNVKMKPYL